MRRYDVIKAHNPAHVTEFALQAMMDAEHLDGLADSCYSVSAYVHDEGGELT
jgi:hypothetical protein